MASFELAALCIFTLHNNTIVFHFHIFVTSLSLSQSLSLSLSLYLSRSLSLSLSIPLSLTLSLSQDPFSVGLAFSSWRHMTLSRIEKQRVKECLILRIPCLTFSSQVSETLSPLLSLLYLSNFLSSLSLTLSFPLFAVETVAPDHYPQLSHHFVVAPSSSVLRDL